MKYTVDTEIKTITFEGQITWRFLNKFFKEFSQFDDYQVISLPTNSFTLNPNQYDYNTNPHCGGIKDLAYPLKLGIEIPDGDKDPKTGKYRSGKIIKE